VTVDRTDNRVVEQRVCSNPHRDEEKRKGIRVAQWLAAQKVDVLFTRVAMEDKGPAYVLRDAGMEIRRTDVRTLAELLSVQLR